MRFAWIVALAVYGYASYSIAQSTTPSLAPSVRPVQDDAIGPTKLLGDSIFAPIPTGEVSKLFGPSFDRVLDIELEVRRTKDVGSVLRHSQTVTGTTTQQRNPVTHDIRIRGARSGQNIGAGSLWHPGRDDLDTALNKIFSANLDQLLVIKGPYSVRHGPGFNFVEMQLEQVPFSPSRSWGGTTSANYETNGEVFVGRQKVWTSNEEWGVRVNYGHGTGNDYDAGNGRFVPASFKSRDAYAALSHRLSSDQTLEFSMLRLDQTDLEYPGLVYDVDYLVTDGYELKYSDLSGNLADELRFEAWYNRTRFEGNSQRPGKAVQIPDLPNAILGGAATTDVDGSSIGYRLSGTTQNSIHALTAGSDVSYLDQTLNDIELMGPMNDRNFPIPHSNSSDIGLFADVDSFWSETLHTTAGIRTDWISARSSNFVEGVPFTVESRKQAALDQSFSLWAAFLSSELRTTENITWRLGVGASQRPPSMTELYSLGSFIGTLQRGLTFVVGDPLLRPEKLRQIDLSMTWQFPRFRGSISGFHAWIEDYITYDLTSPTVTRGGLSTGVIFVNTDLATLSGGEVECSYDLDNMTQLFALANYVYGRDHSRIDGSRLRNVIPGHMGTVRSGVFTQSEALPGIPPLETRLGVRLGERRPDALWSTELMVRIVARQDQVASSLLELPTPSFVTTDIRTFWKLTNRVNLFVGVENLTDTKYFEHLDYRVGRGILRRGRSWYLGSDVSF